MLLVLSVLDCSGLFCYLAMFCSVLHHYYPPPHHHNNTPHCSLLPSLNALLLTLKDLHSLVQHTQHSYKTTNMLRVLTNKNISTYCPH